MSKNCHSCNFPMTDDAVFCPACGAVYDSAAPSAPPKKPAPPTGAPAQPRPYAQPVNAGVQRKIAQPLQRQPQQPAPQPAEQKQKSRLPYVLLGVGAAAVIFVIALIIVLNTGSKPSSGSTASTAPPAATAAVTNGLEGTYKWLNAPENESGTLVIYSNNSALFTYDGKGTLSMVFDPESEEVSYTGADGSLNEGNYEFDGTNLSVTVNGYTDSFQKQ